LIIPKKATGFAPKVTRLKPQLFNEDDALEREDDSEEEEKSEEPVDWVAETLKSQTTVRYSAFPSSSRKNGL
jgi:hypothetical protein